MSKKLQVFVSSTYIDLKQERQAAVAAILKSGHIPAGMELFTSGDQSQWDTIKAWIDESDVYMLILGGRYGSIEPNSKKSYTELEFDYAVSKSKPMFSVVVTDAQLERKVQAGGTSFIETKNGTLLESFRGKVLKYMSSFFDDDKDIKLTVYESLADFAANKDLVGWVRGNNVVDTIPLFDEIKKISEENQKLRAKLSELERQARKENGPNEEFRLLCDVLESEKITIPKTLHKDGPFEISLFSLFCQTQAAFAAGIENQAGMASVDRFLFFTIAPKLQIHGLVQNEKVAGKAYRRYALTQEGQKFLSQVAKMKIEKAEKVAEEPTSVLDEPASKSKVANDGDTEVKKPVRRPRKKLQNEES